jgi:hypothetical protein
MMSLECFYVSNGRGPIRVMVRMRRVVAVVSLVALVIGTFPGLVPVADAQSSSGGAIWTTQIAGAITTPSLTGSHFTNSCTFNGNSSGTGNCSISLYMQMATSSFTCAMKIALTQWSTGLIGPSGPVGFYLDSGQVSATAPTLADESLCIYDSFPAGTVDVSTGDFVSPVNTRVPAAPGHYTFSGYGQLSANAQGTVTYTAPPSSVNLRGQVSINKQQFFSNIPDYPLLGENYTLRVEIQSNASIAVPVIVQVSDPVKSMYINPRIIRLDVPPNGFAVANFTVLPFASPRSSSFNLTAMLFVFFPNSMSSPQLVDQATAIVSSIGPNPFPYLDLLLVSATIVTLILVVVFYPNSFRRLIAAASGGSEAY